jgi:PmbA protein
MRESIDTSKWQALADHILKKAASKGASSAEVSATMADGFTVNIRLGEVDTIEYHRDKGLDIRVYFGQKTGSASTTDFNLSSVDDALQSACSIASATGEDPFQGLADANLMAKNYPDLDLYYPWNITVDNAVEMAKHCESYGRASNSKITNSEGACVSTHKGFYLYANTHGFMGQYPSTRHLIQCVLLAQEGENKERDYEYSLSRDPALLAPLEEIGNSAAKKAVDRLGAQKISTRKTPVLFDASVACGLLGHLTAAMRGGNIYRKSSFLLDHLHQKIFPEFVTIMEDPHILKAIGSAPFDSEGVSTQRRVFVDNGVLESYILNSYAARKLGLVTTGNAGGVRNFHIKPTGENKNELFKMMGTGLLVTEVMGQGINIVTGDYSRGASGYWIENGVAKYPVHEITIAGNLKEMFLNIVAIGNDVDKRGSLWSGSILIENMTVAGH